MCREWLQLLLLMLILLAVLFALVPIVLLLGQASSHGGLPRDSPEIRVTLPRRLGPGHRGPKNSGAKVFVLVCVPAKSV